MPINGRTNASRCPTLGDRDHRDKWAKRHRSDAAQMGMQAHERRLTPPPRGELAEMKQFCVWKKFMLRQIMNIAINDQLQRPSQRGHLTTAATSAEFRKRLLRPQGSRQRVYVATRREERSAPDRRSRRKLGIPMAAPRTRPLVKRSRLHSKRVQRT